MAMDLPLDQSFRIERHGEIAVVTPSAKVEEMHETMIEQAARLVVQSLREDPPAGIVVDLSQVNYFGSVFVSFLLALPRPGQEERQRNRPGRRSANLPRAAQAARSRNPLGDLRHPQGGDRRPERLD